MVLEEFLFPREMIKYQSPGEVMYADDWFDFYITDQRIIAHKSYGLIFKKDRVISERLQDIETLSYDEKGILSKKGILNVGTSAKTMLFEGNPHDMKAVWQELQKFIRRPGVAVSTATTVREGEVGGSVRQPVQPKAPVKYCMYCGTPNATDSGFCKACGRAFPSSTTSREPLF